jgi:hypothetical protein
MKQLTNLDAPSLVTISYGELPTSELTFVRDMYGKVYVAAPTEVGTALFPILTNKSACREGGEPERNQTLSVIAREDLGINELKWTNLRPTTERPRLALTLETCHA